MFSTDTNTGNRQRLAIARVAGRARQAAAELVSSATAGATASPAPGATVAGSEAAHVRAEELAYFIAVAVGFAAVLVERWQQIGTYVTGNDPSSWLALGRQLFGGPGRSAGGTYPPLVPFLAHSVESFLTPMDTAKVIGIGSQAAVMAATLFVALKGMNRWFALAVAVGVGLSTEVNETVAFGGYPQNYGFAFLLLAAFCFARYLQTSSRRWLPLCSAMLAGVALSHHVYYLLACVVVALTWLIWLATRPGRRRAALAAVAGAVAALPSLLLFLPVFLILRREGYGAPLSAGGTDGWLALRSAVIAARWLWIPVIAAGSVYLAFSFPPRRFAVWAVASALLLATLLLFPATGEIRLMPPLTTGALLGVGLALEALRRRTAASIWSTLSFTGAALFVVLLYPLANADAALQFRYYRVADRPLLAAAAWLADHGDQHRVVVRKDGRDWPVGWWFEALTRESIVVGSDPRWMAFPRELSNSALADHIFDPQASAVSVRALATSANVRYLVFRKDWPDWQRWAANMLPPFAVVFDNGEYAIIDLIGTS
jgi:hypothetical protein